MIKSQQITKCHKILLSNLMISLVFGLAMSASAEPVEAGFGKIKVNGLLQFWYQNDNSTVPKDTFRLRRGEVKLSGEIKPDIVSWAVMFDPAQIREDDTQTTNAAPKVITDVGRKSLLQDFVITLKPYKAFSIDFGQHKVPFGMEGLESSAKLDFIERSALAYKFKWADYRDIGFTVKSDFEIGDVKIQPAVGVFNGAGQNRLDDNEPLDFVGRLVIKPIETLHLGVAHYNGQTGTTENMRTGVEIKFSRDPVSVYGEYVAGKSSGKNKRTYYISAGYAFFDSWQAVARYDWYDPDNGQQNDEKYEATIGLNYFIEKHNTKVQLNYVYRGETGTRINDDVIRASVQVNY